METAIPLREVIGPDKNRSLLNVQRFARKVKPRGAGFVPTPRFRQSRSERVAVYRRRRAEGHISDASWAAICNEYPELA
jgi:hypothetical protein